MYEFKCAVRELINNYLEQNETFARLQGYIQLANDNIDIVGKQIQQNNLLYEDCTFVKFSFNKTSFVAHVYEMTLHYKQGREDRYSHFGVDSFLLLLIECGLLVD